MNEAIERFERREFDSLKIREYTYNYDITNFRKEFLEFVESKAQ